MRVGPCSSCPPQRRRQSRDELTTTPPPNPSLPAEFAQLAKDERETTTFALGLPGRAGRERSVARWAAVESSGTSPSWTARR